MPDTIESFVKRLQSEGVEGGRQAAEKIEAEAKDQATQILQEAESKAAEIRAQAEADATSHRNKIEGELRLAVRDTVLELRETLSGMLQRLLSTKVEGQMSDEAFLKNLIQEVLQQYTKADSEGIGDIRINLTPDMEKKLAQWAVNELQQALEKSGRNVEVQGTLESAGFEYRVTQGTVAVTTESVAAKLQELARPELSKLLSESGENAGERGSGETSQAPSSSQ
jgi:V/A-type H+-transporting ATPase subunit E